MVPCRNRRNCCQTAKMSHIDRLSQKHTLPKLTDQSRVCVNDFSTIFPICVSCLLIPLSSCTCLILCGRGLCVKCSLCVSKATLCIFKCITDFFLFARSCLYMSLYYASWHHFMQNVTGLDLGLLKMYLTALPLLFSPPIFFSLPFSSNVITWYSCNSWLTL